MDSPYSKHVETVSNDDIEMNVVKYEDEDFETGNGPLLKMRRSAMTQKTEEK